MNMNFGLRAELMAHADYAIDFLGCNVRDNAAFEGVVNNFCGILKVLTTEIQNKAFCYE